MAQYFEDFRDAVLDSTPSYFTTPWGAFLSAVVKAGNELPGSNRHILITPSGGSFVRAALKWGDIVTSGKTAVRALIEFTPTNGINTQNSIFPGCVVSGSGTSTTRTGYVHWYRDNDAISKYNNGSDGSIATRVITLSTSLIRLYVETTRDGSTIEVRSWLYGGSRPTIPDLTITDASPLPVSGWVGFSYLAGSAAPTGKLLSIAAATNGDAVPTGPVGGSVPQDINTIGISSSVEFGQLALSPGAASILADAIDGNEQFGIANFTAGPVSIMASGIPSEEVVSPMAFYAGGSAIFAESIAGAEQFGDASFIPGPVSISAVAIASESIVSSHEFIAGPAVIYADSVASAEIFGDLKLFNVQQLIRLVGIGTAEAFGSTTIEGGADLSGWLTGRINIKPALTASVGVNRVH